MSFNISEHPQSVAARSGIAHATGGGPANSNLVCLSDFLLPYNVKPLEVQTDAPNSRRFGGVGLDSDGAQGDCANAPSSQPSGGTGSLRNWTESPGVIEARPGIIESANIDPLNENSNKDDGWANVPSGHRTKKPGNIAPGAMKLAYGHLTGKEELKQAGREAVHGDK